MFRFALMLALAAVPAATLASPIELGAVQVVDGDTIRAGGRTVRLVGFDAPETGSRARCESERTLGAAASFARARLPRAAQPATLRKITSPWPQGRRQKASRRSVVEDKRAAYALGVQRPAFANSGPSAQLCH